MQRIETYLAEGEVPEWSSSLHETKDGQSVTEDIGFVRATFEWPAVPHASLSENNFKLGPLDFTFPKGGLTLITGATGSGKSAMLASLLGGM